MASFAMTLAVASAIRIIGITGQIDVRHVVSHTQIPQIGPTGAGQGLKERHRGLKRAPPSVSTTCTSAPALPNNRTNSAAL